MKKYKNLTIKLNKTWRLYMPNLELKLTINGRKIKKTTFSHYRLLDFLREDLDLTGTKEGCGAGECGTCSVFINGKLVKRHLLSGVPKQNYDDVYVAMNGGFSGYVSSLQYFSEAIGINKIQNIVNDGPNLKMLGDTRVTNNVPHYLSLRWFFSDANNMYNP